MFKKLKTYAKITNLWAIARRYFVNNFYDGMLTVLGILIGFFILIIESETHTISSRIVILTGLGTSISMFISGSTSSYLSEKAEQRKLKLEIYNAMILNEMNENQNLGEKASIEEIEKAMLMQLKRRRNKIKTYKDEEERKKKSKNITERAETFTIIIVSFVNGLSPFLGGFISLLPFIFDPVAGLDTFISSFLIIFVCIILLGTFLGVISKESIVKNIFQMLGAFSLTIVILLFLLA